MALAIPAVTLGALAPVACLFAAQVPPPDPAHLGLPAGDPRVVAALDSARALLLVHVCVIAIAGVVGVLRLRALLGRLVPRKTVARQVLISWLLVEGLVGSQLSWLLRPFLGKPHLEVRFLRGDAFEGNFFEEVARAASGEGAVILSMFGVFLSLLVGVALLGDPDDAQLVWGPQRARLRVGGEEILLPWIAFTRFEAIGRRLFVAWRDPETMTSRQARIDFPSAVEARAAVARLQALRTRRAAGPFRTGASEASFRKARNALGEP